MPVGVAPHKQAPDDPGPLLRLELCEAATAGDERIEVSRLELDRDGPSYTVDTLRAIHATSPGDELTFIAGGDMAMSLPEWREPEALLELATLAVAERAGARRAEISERLRGLHRDDRIRFLSTPRLDVSSSAVRERVRAGRPIRYLVPDPVERLIGEYGLYRAEVVQS